MGDVDRAERAQQPLLQLRFSEVYMDRIDAVAGLRGERRSDWVRRVIVAGVEQAEAADRMRREAEQRMRMGGAS